MSQQDSNVSLNNPANFPQAHGDQNMRPQQNTNDQIALGSGLIGSNEQGNYDNQHPGGGVYDDPELYQGTESQAALLPFNPNYPKSKYLKSLT